MSPLTDGPEKGRLLAIDLGTSAVKVGLFSANGDLERYARQGYSSDRGQAADRLDQDPDIWWAATRRALAEVLDHAAAASLLAVGVGGQGPSLVLVDADGRPTRGVVAWNDRRPDANAAQLAELPGAEHAVYSLVPRLAWVAEHEPEVLGRSRWALQAWDFIGYRLTGATRAAASSLPGDVVWNRAWLAEVGLRLEHLLPRAVDAGAVYARTAGPWAREAGVPEGVPVVGGLNDGIGALLGADVTLPGRAADPGGASGGLGLCWNRPLLAPGISSWPGAAPGTWIVGGALAATGAAVDWWAAVMGQPVATVLALAERAEPGAGGVVFMPFLHGERAPLWDPDVRASFVGISSASGAAELTRAVVESSGYAIRLLGDAVVAAGGRIDELRLCGGQSRSPFWNQLKCDVTGYPVRVPVVPDAALTAAVLCAAVGAGLRPTLVDAARTMVKMGARLVPDPTRHKIYEQRFSTYRSAYAVLRALAHDDVSH